MTSHKIGTTDQQKLVDQIRTMPRTERVWLKREDWIEEGQPGQCQEKIYWWKEQMREVNDRLTDERKRQHAVWPAGESLPPGRAQTPSSFLYNFHALLLLFLHIFFIELLLLLLLHLGLQTQRGFSMKSARIATATNEWFLRRNRKPLLSRLRRLHASQRSRFLLLWRLVSIFLFFKLFLLRP